MHKIWKWYLKANLHYILETIPSTDWEMNRWMDWKTRWINYTSIPNVWVGLYKSKEQTSKTHYFNGGICIQKTIPFPMNAPTVCFYLQLHSQSWQHIQYLSQQSCLYLVIEPAELAGVHVASMNTETKRSKWNEICLMKRCVFRSCFLYMDPWYIKTLIESSVHNGSINLLYSFIHSPKTAKCQKGYVNFNDG